MWYGSAERVCSYANVAISNITTLFSSSYFGVVIVVMLSVGLSDYKLYANLYKAIFHIP